FQKSAARFGRHGNPPATFRRGGGRVVHFSPEYNARSGGEEMTNFDFRRNKQRGPTLGGWPAPSLARRSLQAEEHPLNRGGAPHQVGHPQRDPAVKKERQEPADQAR